MFTVDPIRKRRDRMVIERAPAPVDPPARRPPLPGPMGQRIFENVSKQAWQGWIEQQTRLINEYRLTPIEPKAREFLEQEMEKYFFGDGSEKPKEFTEPGK